MEYILLRRNYSHGNTSWQPVRFISDPHAAREKLLASKGPFHLKDLYAIIPAEGVSDIPKHLKWLAMAVTRNSLKEYLEFPTLSKNWLQAYEGVGVKASEIMPALKLFNDFQLIQISIECFKLCQEYDGKLILDTIETYERWVRREASRNQVIIAENRIPSGSSSVNRMTKLLGNAILDEIGGFTVFSETIDWVLNVEIMKTMSFKTRDAKDREMAEIIQQYAPMADVMSSLKRVE